MNERQKRNAVAGLTSTARRYMEMARRADARGDHSLALRLNVLAVDLETEALSLRLELETY